MWTAKSQAPLVWLPVVFQSNLIFIRLQITYYGFTSCLLDIASLMLSLRSSQWSENVYQFSGTHPLHFLSTHSFFVLWTLYMCYYRWCDHVVLIVLIFHFNPTMSNYFTYVFKHSHNAFTFFIWIMNVLTFTVPTFKYIKMDLQEIGWVSVDWIDMAQDRVRWQAVT